MSNPSNSPGGPPAPLKPTAFLTAKVGYYVTTGCGKYLGPFPLVLTEGRDWEKEKVKEEGVNSSPRNWEYGEFPQQHSSH